MVLWEDLFDKERFKLIFERIIEVNLAKKINSGKSNMGKGNSKQMGRL